MFLIIQNLKSIYGMFVNNDLSSKKSKFFSLNDLRAAGLTGSSSFDLYTTELRQMCLDSTKTDYLSLNECDSYGIEVNNWQSTDREKLVPVFNCSILNPICLVYRNTGYSGEGTITKVSGREMKSSDKIYAVVKIRVELNNSSKFYIFNYSSSTVQGNSVSLSYGQPYVYENGTSLNNKAYYGDEFNNANTISYDVSRISLVSANLYGTGIESYTASTKSFKYSLYRGKSTSVLSSTANTLNLGSTFTQDKLLAWNKNGASKNLQLYIEPSVDFNVTMETGIPNIVVTSADTGTCIIRNVPAGASVYLNFVIGYFYELGRPPVYGHYYTIDTSNNGTYNGALSIGNCYSDASGLGTSLGKGAYKYIYDTLAVAEVEGYRNQHTYEFTKILLSINNEFKYTSQFSIDHAGFYYEATYGGQTVSGYKEDNNNETLTAADFASLLNRTPLSGEEYIPVKITPRVEVTLL